MQQIDSVFLNVSRGRTPRPFPGAPTLNKTSPMFGQETPGSTRPWALPPKKLGPVDHAQCLL